MVAKIFKPLHGGVLLQGLCSMIYEGNYLGPRSKRKPRVKRFRTESNYIIPKIRHQDSAILEEINQAQIEHNDEFDTQDWIDYFTENDDCTYVGEEIAMVGSFKGMDDIPVKGRLLHMKPLLIQLFKELERKGLVKIKK